MREQAPTVCFLMETRLDKDGFEDLYSNLPLPNKFIVKHPNAGGGLAFCGRTLLIWRLLIILQTMF